MVACCSSRNSSNGLSNLNFSRPFNNKMIFTFLFSSELSLSIVGNFFILLIIYKSKRLRTTTNYFVANMAASDLLAIFFVFPSKVISINFDGQWLLNGDIGNVMCKMRKFIIETSLSVSVYSCVVIAIDRYYAVAHPLKKPLQTRIKFTILCQWVISCLLKFPMWYFLQTQETNHGISCMVSKAIYSVYLVYYYIITSLTLGLAAVFVTVTYSLIIYKLRRRRLPGHQSEQATRRRVIKNRKALRLSATIVVSLSASWGIRSIIAILNDTGQLNHLSWSAKLDVLHVSYFVLYMSYVYNFFIFLIFNDIFRNTFMSFTFGHCLKFRPNTIVVATDDGDKTRGASLEMKRSVQN